MIAHRVWNRLALMGALLTAAFVAQAEEQGPQPPAGFKRLFNGANLDGWQEVQGKPGTFHVENGVLVGRRSSGSAYWLSTEDQYGDFVLKLQYKLRPNGNSGVFIRAPRNGRTSREGMEIQLRDDGDKRGRPGKGNTGAIYSVVAPDAFASRPAGKWNRLEILCDGERVRVTLNGSVVTDARMDEHDALRKRPRKGYIGLSAHTDRVEFRDVWLRELSDD